MIKVIQADITTLAVDAICCFSKWDAEVYERMT